VIALLHLDVPTWTNAGGIIVLPVILLVLLGAIVPAIHDWVDR